MPSGFSSCILPLEDEWSQVFATSPILTPLALLIFRVFSAGIFLGHAIAHICYYSFRGWAYWIYLTNWALILQTVSECLLLALALHGSRVNQSRTPPATARFAVVLSSMAQPTSLIVTLLFFFLINPIWKFRPIPYIAFFPHFLNWFLLLIGLLVSRIPFALERHMGWPMLFAGIFIAWTVLHFYLKIGRNEPCFNYPLHDCPIYNQLDWHHPQGAGMTVLIAMTGMVLVCALYSKLVQCRDCTQSSSRVEEVELELAG